MYFSDYFCSNRLMPFTFIIWLNRFLLSWIRINGLWTRHILRNFDRIFEFSDTKEHGSGKSIISLKHERRKYCKGIASPDGDENGLYTCIYARYLQNPNKDHMPKVSRFCIRNRICENPVQEILTNLKFEE